MIVICVCSRRSQILKAGVGSMALSVADSLQGTSTLLALRKVYTATNLNGLYTTSKSGRVLPIQCSNKILTCMEPIFLRTCTYAVQDIT